MRQVVLTAAAISVAVILDTSALAKVSFAADDTAKAHHEAKTQAAEISDARSKAFAIASTMIMKIRQKYLPQTQSAGGEGEARKIPTPAQNEMLQAVSANGLTVDQYHAVVDAARQDKSLVERIRDLHKSSESKI